MGGLKFPSPLWPNSEKFLGILVQVHFYPPLPHGPTVEFFLNGFIHFTKFPAYNDYCVPIYWDLGSTGSLKL